MKKIIKFWNHGCINCKALEPFLAAIKSQHPDIEFTSVNSKDDSATADKYGITTLPTLIFEKDGEEVGRMMGLKPKSLILKKIDEVF